MPSAAGRGVEYSARKRTVVTGNNRPAVHLLVDERVKQGDNAFAELRVVRVPESVRGSAHTFNSACRWW